MKEKEDLVKANERAKVLMIASIILLLFSLISFIISLISNDDNTQSIIAFRRMNKKGEEIIAVCNFVPVAREDYRIGVPVAGSYKRIFCSDDVKYGGSTEPKKVGYKAEKKRMHNLDYSISIDIPPMSVSFFALPKKRETKTNTNTKTKK